MALATLFDTTKKSTIQKFEELVNSLAEDGYEIDELRIAKSGTNCRWVRKVYIRHGKKYVKYKKVCD